MEMGIEDDGQEDQFHFMVAACSLFHQGQRDSYSMLRLRHEQG